HARRDEEERLPGDVEQHQRAADRQAGPGGEEQEGVGGHHPGLLDRPHGVDVVQPPLLGPLGLLGHRARRDASVGLPVRWCLAARWCLVTRWCGRGGGGSRRDRRWSPGADGGQLTSRLKMAASRPTWELRILPLVPAGSRSTTWKATGRLGRDRSRAQRSCSRPTMVSARTRSSSPATPSATRKATGTRPSTWWSQPTTTTERTSGSARMISSTSRGRIFSPPRLITSSARPTRKRY